MKPTLTIPNPLYWLNVHVALPIRVRWWTLHARLFPPHNLCQHCQKDVGASLWGWCSIECFKALTKDLPPS